MHEPGGTTSLNSKEARRLVDLVVQAQDLEAAIAAAELAFSFLVRQLHVLGDNANGYPQNGIDGQVWKEGYELTSVCDGFADAVARWNQRRGEEQATRLAVSMALQVVAHYPEEIFPRVLRNAKCCESLGKTDEAADGYRYVIRNFSALDLDHLLEPSEVPDLAATTILACVRDSLAALQRLTPQGLTNDDLALNVRVNDALVRATVSSGATAAQQAVEADGRASS